MKITYITRTPKPSGFSIEKVFENIIPIIARSCDVDIFKPNKEKSLIQNLFTLLKTKSDIYHITGDINYYIFVLPRKKTVITVHDIGHFVYTLKGWKKWLYWLVWLQLPLRYAKKITTVSETTKLQIIKHLHINPSKIEVIPNAIPSNYKLCSKEFNINKPIILQIGSKSYKNVPRVLEAIKDLNCKFVLVGTITEEIKDVINKYNLKIENFVNISDAEIMEQYTRCDIVTFVSTGEGFGVPIIEANAIGRPIITSNISPMNTVAENAAYLANPLDIQDIKFGINKIISDKIYREQIIKNGIENAKKYFPEKIAQMYLSVYNSKFKK